MRWKHRPEGSNWGDFGTEDQVGRMNLVTPARRLAAVREVTEGLAFCLSLPLDYPGGGNLVPSRRAPRIEPRAAPPASSATTSASRARTSRCSTWCPTTQ
jgi:hypothetical protein